MLPSNIFSGEEVEIDPPDKLFEVEFEFSDEDTDLPYELPRLELRYEEQPDVPGVMDMQEWMWFWINSPLSCAASFLFKSGFKQYQVNKYNKAEVSRRYFVRQTTLKLEKV